MRKLLALLLSVILCTSIISAALAEQDAAAGTSEATTIPFGAYPQTADGTDSTPIEWIILDYREDEGRALLLSRYVLDAKPYNDKKAAVTWDECTLRAWLNNEFLQQAFLAEDQALILSTRLRNDTDQYQRVGLTPSGKDTEDRVFLLSYAEARDYVGVTGEEALDNLYSRAYPTEYALAKGVQQKKWDWDGETVPWWLRTPGVINNMMNTVEGNGSVDTHYVEADNMGIRPAIWVNLYPDGDRAAYDRQIKVREFSTIGNTVKYGHYEQDNKGGPPEPEEIEWIVLDVYENKALLLSRYGLNSEPYQYEDYPADTTWENSHVRNWLQEKFLPEAFTKEEQAAIVKGKVNNSKKHVSKWKTKGGNNTKDKIFLLSYAEAEKYQEIVWKKTYNTKAGVILTDYAVRKGAKRNNWCYIDLNPAMLYPGWWWLRTPGSNSGRAAIVDADGNLSDKYMDEEGGAIRPAFWLDLDKAPF